MQAIFSFTRLGLLIKKQWADHARLYGLSLVAITGLVAIAFFLWGINGGPEVRWIEPTTIIMFVGLFLGGCIFSGMTFSELSQRTTGIYYLAVPATHLEKLVCGILYSQVFFNAIYLGVFFLLRAIAFSIIAMYPAIHLQHLPDAAHFAETYFYIALVYAAVQTFYLLGSVYFERFAFVKTTVGGILLLLLLVLFVQYVIIPIVPHNGHWEGGNTFIVEEGEGQKRQFIKYVLPQRLIDILRYTLFYVWVPVFWVATYFRLSEKEL
jgi:hypothetical protein